MKCAIILRGESFRSGHEIKHIGEPDSVEEQLAAARSHVQLAVQISRLGTTPDIYITTIRTPYTDQLLDIYNPYLKDSNIRETPFPSQMASLLEAVGRVKLEDYDCVLIIRCDNEFKPLFYNSFYIDDKITFISICWHKDRKTPQGNPRINDMYYQFPKACFQILQEAIHKEAFGHNLLDNCHIPQEKYRFVTPYFYDSDSAKDKNPYYRVVNRPECNIHHSESKQYPQDF